jgi:hypothetical protein
MTWLDHEKRIRKLEAADKMQPATRAVAAAEPPAGDGATTGAC